VLLCDREASIMTPWPTSGCCAMEKKTCEVRVGHDPAHCATVPFPFLGGVVASRFFSVSLKVLSQGNLRRRSLQGPRSATRG
jgi:hypothetical protein